MTDDAPDHRERPGARLDRSARVADCVQLLAIEPLLVHAGDDLLEVLRRAAHQPSTRLIGVVDDAGIMIGVLSGFWVGVGMGVLIRSGSHKPGDEKLTGFSPGMRYRVMEAPSV